MNSIKIIYPPPIHEGLIRRFALTSRLVCLASLISIISIYGCADSNPNFATGGEIDEPVIAGGLLEVDTTSDEVSAGEGSAGENTAGENAAGESVAGENAAGENAAGESVAGESVAGESVAGESAAGESAAGESAAGESVAGEISAGEDIAGESAAGEDTAGESAAGEDTAGESAAGEDTAGESTAGTITPTDRDGDGAPASEDCDDNNALRSPLLSEVCDNLDNDCDTAVDEGTLNACGACGEVPREVCDGRDNDCDGATDEGTLNACGACGEVPREVCDGRDNDCDSATDEGTLNACGACGEVPEEVCDGRDNDCDGATDEGTLNACGACGEVPEEVCDGRDNDCDGATDEGTLNACGACGEVPIEVCDNSDNDCDGATDEGTLNACGACGTSPEICDGVDNDCDTQVDEALTEPCFALIQTIEAPAGVTDLKRLTLVGDLDQDGIEDVVALGLDDDDPTLLALSSAGQLLWSVVGSGDFARAVTSGAYNDAQEVAVSDPENEQVVLYNTSGDETRALTVTEGAVDSLATISVQTQGQRIEALVMGISSYRERSSNAGIIKAARLDSVTNVDDPTYLYEVVGDFNQRWGRHLYRIADLDGDGSDDLIFTRRSNLDTRTQLMSGASGFSSAGSLLSGINDDTNRSFATSFVVGRVYENSVSFVFGAPRFSNPLNERGAIYSLSDQGSSFTLDPPLYGGEERAQIGRALAILPRPDAVTDVLLIGTRNVVGGEIIIYESSSNLIVGIPAPNDTLAVGEGVAVSPSRQPDGTYRVWISGSSATAGASRIWIYSAR